MRAPEPPSVDDSRAVTLATDAGEDALARTFADDGRPPPSRAASAVMERGDQLGRYLVLARLGAGGMGVVYAAYDPELDRKLAIKLWHQQAGMATTADLAHGRLQREAQALARLAHPNVVAVHDVGTHDGRLFVAMEYVDGWTLTDWLRQEPRTPAQIVEVFLAAGRGLAAAHAVDLVHRDIKPDNLMIGRDGRVRVMDFGLARAAGSVETSVGEVERQRGLSALDRNLTRTGGVLGTPAYMSPEQFGGEPTDARGDQFAFCVALWEALHGEAPFGGETLTELVQNVVDGRVRPPPRGRAVPPYLKRVLLRGLRRDPVDRWPSMTALLAALADDPRIRRRRWLLGGALAAALGGAASVVVLRDSDDRCAGAEDRWAAVWDEARADVVRAALVATGRPHANATADRVRALLDERGRAWAATRRDACLATYVRGEQSDSLLDLRTRCLGERLHEVEVLADQLAHADAEAADRAVAATAGLTPIAACDDAEALLAAVPPPADPATRAAVEALRARLVAVEGMIRLGRYAAARPLADAIVREGEALGYKPLVGDALRVAADVAGLDGDPAAAEPLMFAAIDASAAARDLEGHARAWIALTRLAAMELRRPQDAMKWSRAMTAAVQLLPASLELRAKARSVAAVALEANSEFAAAERAFTEAHEALVAAHGAEHPDLARVDAARGAMLRELGRRDEARVEFERALALGLKVLGEHHPSIAGFRINLANLATDAGDYEGARREMSAALRLREETLGPRHYRVGQAMYNVAHLDMLRGDLEAARRGAEAALAIFEEALGPGHADVAMALNFLGAIARRDGRFADAEAFYRRSLEISEATLGSDNPEIGFAIYNLGDIAVARERWADAVPHFERALALWEKAYGPDHTELTYPLLGLAAVALERGDAQASLALAERALAIVAARDDQVERRVVARYRVAAALHRLRRALPRARELAEAALAEAPSLAEGTSLSTHIEALLKEL